MNGGRPDSIADTSAVVRLLRRDPPAEQRLQGRSFAITFVTLPELDMGILKANDPIAALQSWLEVLAGHQVFSITAAGKRAENGPPVDSAEIRCWPRFPDTDLTKYRHPSFGPLRLIRE